MTTAGLRGVVGAIRRYGRAGLLRPAASVVEVAGRWRAGRPAATVDGGILLQADDGPYREAVATLSGATLSGAMLTGREFRLGESRTWHRVGSVRAEYGNGLALVMVEPETWAGELRDGVDVTWARGYEATDEYAARVVRRERQAVFYATAGRYFGEALFLVGAGDLGASGYPVAEGLRAGVGLTVDGEHYLVMDSRAVGDGVTTYYWELLCALPLEGARATLAVTDGGPLASGSEADFTLAVDGDGAGVWQWRLEELAAGAWVDVAGGGFDDQLAAAVAGTAGAHRYRGLGWHRDGGYYPTNTVGVEWE